MYLYTCIYIYMYIHMCSYLVLMCVCTCRPISRALNKVCKNARKHCVTARLHAACCEEFVIRTRRRRTRPAARGSLTAAWQPGPLELAARGRSSSFWVWGWCRPQSVPSCPQIRESLENSLELNSSKAFLNTLIPSSPVPYTSWLLYVVPHRMLVLARGQEPTI